MWPPPSINQSSSVEVAVISPPSGLHNTDRREHCFLSSKLIAELDLSFDPKVDNYGQVRIFHRPGSVPNLPYDFSANFTVAGEAVNPPAERVIQIYPNTSTSPGGVKRLTGADGTQ